MTREEKLALYERMKSIAPDVTDFVQLLRENGFERARMVDFVTEDGEKLL